MTYGRSCSKRLGNAFVALLQAKKALDEIPESCLPASCPRKGGVAKLLWACDALQNDRSTLLEAVLQRRCVFESLDPALLADKEFMLAAVKRDGMALRYAAKNLQKDGDVARSAVEENGCAVSFARSFFDDKSVMLSAVQSNGLALRFASERLAADRELVLAAVEQTGEALQFAKGGLRSDRGIARAAIESSGHAVRFLEGELRNDRDLALASVRECGDALQHLPDPFTKDKEIVLAAVQKDGDSLYYADRKLKADFEVAMAAVENNGHSLLHADESLANWDDLVLTAVRSSPRALLQATKQKLADYDFCKEAARRNGLTIYYMNDEFRRNFDIALAAVRQNPDALWDAPETLRSDQRVVLEAISSKWQVARHATEELHQDPEVLSKIADCLPDGEPECELGLVRVRLASGEIRGSIHAIGLRTMDLRVAIERVFDIENAFQNLLVEGCSRTFLDSEVIYPEIALAALRHARTEGRAKRLPDITVVISPPVESPRYW